VPTILPAVVDTAFILLPSTVQTFLGKSQNCFVADIFDWHRIIFNV